MLYNKAFVFVILKSYVLLLTEKKDVPQHLIILMHNLNWTRSYSYDRIWRSAMVFLLTRVSDKGTLYHLISSIYMQYI